MSYNWPKDLVLAVLPNKHNTKNCHPEANSYYLGMSYNWPKYLVLAVLPNKHDTKNCHPEADSCNSGMSYNWPKDLVLAVPSSCNVYFHVILRPTLVIQAYLTIGLRTLYLYLYQKTDREDAKEHQSSEILTGRPSWCDAIAARAMYIAFSPS
jgi:hypothetical protein